ncbi:MAG TPA: DUF1343 domain-containing protein [Verrucomicrobiae bacterium]|jgi:uncharacterized protein YbbC (DUF1343 family)|nr:DUF1343 domain-containing protein [Verrucomicrobiae bacterium]
MKTMRWNECKASQRLALRLFLVPLLCCIAVAAQTNVAHGANAQRARHSRLATKVMVGLDVLEAERFAPLRGKHVGIITNHTGLDAQGRTTIDALTHAPGIQVVALFTPEHGLGGTKDENVASTKDPVSGLPVYSLYGETRRPTDEMLAGIDALVFDVQDAGVRFYTYTTTMAYCMEEAAKRKIAFFVLDRPDPIGGEIVEGPMLDEDKTSFTAYFRLPVRYALTIGELAQLFNEENHIRCDLHVIPMKNWRRNYFYEETGLRWFPPSPNLRTLKGSVLYPGLEILQNGGVSVGRGTEAPFEEFGAPWMHGEDVAARLNERHLAGVRFIAADFIPVAGSYAAERCGGVAIRVLDKRAVRSMTMGIEIASILRQLYADHFDVQKMLFLVGNDQTIRQLQDGAPASEIVKGWDADLKIFEVTRRKYFLYK